MDKLQEECGIVGVYGAEKSAALLHLGLFALQHRGQEGCGIVTSDGEASTEEMSFFEHRSLELVGDSFPAHVLAQLRGKNGIGHVRYSTQGGKFIHNVQPFSFQLVGFGSVAIAHNGNITNAKILRSELEKKGSVFRTTSDTEVFIHLLARETDHSFEDRLSKTLKQVHGAFSLVIITANHLYAIRDSFGFRPLIYGKGADGSFACASETCALDLMEYEYIGSVDPGQIVRFGSDGVKLFDFGGVQSGSKFCSFEPIYFARPDSIHDGDLYYDIRKNLGRVLAEEQPAVADVVCAIPDSGVPMAMGYAQQSGIPFDVGLVRNHYVGRTFIEPTQSSRDLRVRLKLNPMLSVLKGKRVVVVDDSVVRGTTCIKILNMIRKAGAKEIHFRVASPPITHSCFYGIDTPDRGQLMAAQKNIHQMREVMGADTIGFLSVEGLKRAFGKNHQNKYCYACFTGQYPEEIHVNIARQLTDISGGPGLSSADKQK